MGNCVIREMLLILEEHPDMCTNICNVYKWAAAIVEKDEQEEEAWRSLCLQGEEK